MTCPRCTLEVGSGCECAPCKWCGEPLHVCHERVDERFPQAARDAYALADRTTAPTCARGEASDMYETLHGPRGGWCISRAVGHPEWTGATPDRVDPRVATNRRRPGARDPKKALTEPIL